MNSVGYFNHHKQTYIDYYIYKHLTYMIKCKTSCIIHYAKIGCTIRQTLRKTMKYTQIICTERNADVTVVTYFTCSLKSI